MDNNINEFKKCYKEILDKLVNKNKEIFNCFDEETNIILQDSINKFNYMNCDGKYLRGTLIDLGYKINGKKKDYSLPLSIAYETFQTSILIHDDIIDNASLRRGKETIPYMYKKEFEKYNCYDNTPSNLGICIGDLGLYYSNKIILDNYSNDKNIIKLLSYYNNIVIKTIKGEIIDVYLPFISKNNNKYSTKEEDVMLIYKLKTSWYTIVGPFCLGLILGGSDEKLIKDMEDALEPLGIAFQIKDDILDIMSTNEEIGKSVCSDIEEYKQTILYSYLSNNHKYLNEIKKYYGKSNITDKEKEIVKKILIDSGSLKYAEDKMNELVFISKEKLSNIDIPIRYKNILYGLIEYLCSRKK